MTSLRGARLVLATQQHLTLNPFFVDSLRLATGKDHTLVLVDESDLLLRPFERVVSGPELVRFVDILKVLNSHHSAITTWVETSELLQQASEAALRSSEWSLPRLDRKWAQKIQEIGWNTYGNQFRFIAYELRQFARSDRISRARMPDGGIRFTIAPDLGDERIIFSGSMPKEFARYRLDPNHSRVGISSPFADHRFRHPDTNWYNLAATAGMAEYFPSNSERVLDVFARLIARNILEGKRTLLVCKKRFKQLCRDSLKKRLASLGSGNVKIVTGNWKRHDLNDPRTIPMISYGISGVNRFEHCEACYCLTSYYTLSSAVESLVNDYEPASRRVKVNLQFQKAKPRRIAFIEDSAVHDTIVPRLAKWALEQKEAEVVLQAVGRVRPFTRPREVITFQIGELPGVDFDREFESLADLRSHFNLETPSESEVRSRREEAIRLRAKGHSNREIAKQIGVSRATVTRYLNP